MQLNALIARQIIERAQKIITHPINVMDEQGVIIGASDPSRLKHIHEGAQRALRDNRSIEITHIEAQQLSGVKQGINLPIFYDTRMVGVVGISGDPEQVRSYGELIRMTAELIIEQAALMSQLQWDKRHREELLLQLIEGSFNNDAQLSTLAQRLDIDLSQARIAVIMQLLPKRGSTITLSHLQKLVHLLEYPERGNLVGIASVSQNEVVVLKPVSLKNQTWDRESEEKRLDELAKRIHLENDFKVRIAVGDYFPNLLGIAKSYETAKAALAMCTKQNTQRLFYQDHKLALVLNCLNIEDWRASEIKSPLNKLNASDTNGLLLKTLRVYLKQNCDMQQTCELLHIHRNTLRYRLDRIEQETSLKLNNLDNLFQVYLALEWL